MEDISQTSPLNEEVGIEETVNEKDFGGHSSKKVYVLDTNVFLIDARALYAFGKNEVVIPITVIEELDKFKTFDGITGANARKSARELNKFFGNNYLALSKGVTLSNGTRLKIKTTCDFNKIPNTLDKNKNDNKILLTALSLTKSLKSRKVILVTNDVTMTIKASSLGVFTQEYTPDKRDGIELDDLSQYTGQRNLTVDDDIVENINNDKQTILPVIQNIHVNEFLVLRSNQNNKKTALVRFLGQGKPLRKIFTSKQVSFYGITPRNKDQRLCVDLLSDPSVEMITISGEAGSGKAQPLDSLVLTPTGYVKMGSLFVGDKVSCPVTGKSNTIVGIYPQGVQDVYKVKFSDGTIAESTLDHLWFVWNEHLRSDYSEVERQDFKFGEVKTLGEIKDKLLGHDGRKNFSIPTTKPVEFELNEKLLIDPYILGLLIGDGGFKYTQTMFSSKDSELVDVMSKYIQIKYEEKMVVKHKSSYDYCIRNVIKYGTNYLAMDLKELGLMGVGCYSKFIPNSYLRASIEDRVSLLQGLIDTDGYVDKTGAIEFSTSSSLLKDNVIYLVQSLGGIALERSKIPTYKYKGEKKTGKVNYTISINLPYFELCRLSRKRNLLKPRKKYLPTRYIESVEFSRKELCQCIKVDSKEELYLTNNFVVTHNTLLALSVALHLVLEKKMYDKLVILRPIKPFGDEMGFLPGDVSEKLDPWMAPIRDNLGEVFNGRGNSRNSRKSGEQIEDLVEQGYIEIAALTYIKGRTLKNSFIIVDEAEDLTAKEVKMLATRVGEGSKIVFTGDTSQIDNPNINATDCGMAKALRALINEPSVAHITLPVSERSSLAGLVAKRM